MCQWQEQERNLIEKLLMALSYPLQDYDGIFSLVSKLIHICKVIRLIFWCCVVRFSFAFDAEWSYSYRSSIHLFLLHTWPWKNSWIASVRYTHQLTFMYTNKQNYAALNWLRGHNYILRIIKSKLSRTIKRIWFSGLKTVFFNAFSLHLVRDYYVVI